MLLGFQADLGGISDEIKHLQVNYVLNVHDLSLACTSTTTYILERRVVHLTCFIERYHPKWANSISTHILQYSCADKRKPINKWCLSFRFCEMMDDADSVTTPKGCCAVPCCAVLCCALLFTRVMSRHVTDIENIKVCDLTWSAFPQDESISMNIKLKNLRSAEEDLGKFLGNVLVTSELVTSICGDEVNDAFLEYVVDLNNKVTHVLFPLAKKSTVSRIADVELLIMRQRRLLYAFPRRSSTSDRLMQHKMAPVWTWLLQQLWQQKVYDPTSTISKPR